MGTLSHCRAILIATIVLLLSSCQSSGPRSEVPKSEIRFYTINNQNQQRELSWLPKRHVAGCFNLPVPVGLYRVVQIGFTTCSVYRAKNCILADAHQMLWSGKSRKGSDKKKPTTKLTEGALWLFNSSREAAVRSWHCDL